MISPAPLLKGDTIALVSPAKAIEETTVLFVKNYLEKQGFKVLISQNALGRHTYFSGTDEERAGDLQWAIDHPEIKAILFNRGGYGAVRILDRVNWANWMREPKWLIGFSDITHFHLLGLKLGIETIHGSMPLNFESNTPLALESLIQTITQNTVSHAWQTEQWSKSGDVHGPLIGGNMSIVYAMLGTTYRPNFEGAILFLEDLGEQMYHMDRMVQAFKLAGVFEKINGLVIGGMTDMKDTDPPTNWTINSLFKDVLQYRNIPVCFDAPIGHIDDNRAVIVGRNARLKVENGQCLLSQDSVINIL